MPLPHAAASSSLSWATFHDLLENMILVFGTAAFQRQRCLQVVETFSPAWDGLREATQEALIKDLSEKLERAKDAETKWHRANPGTHWGWNWKTVIDCLPDAHSLVKAVQLKEPWTRPLPESLLDDMLQEFKRLSNHHDTIRRKAQEIARSEVLAGWNSLNPACQLEILDYTKSVYDKFSEWNAERVLRRQKKTSTDWGIYFPKLAVYETIIKKHQASQTNDTSSFRGKAATPQGEHRSIPPATSKRRLSGDLGPHTAQRRPETSPVQVLDTKRRKHRSPSPSEKEGWESWLNHDFV